MIPAYSPGKAADDIMATLEQAPWSPGCGSPASLASPTPKKARRDDGVMPLQLFSSMTTTMAAPSLGGQPSRAAMRNMARTSAQSAPQPGQSSAPPSVAVALPPAPCAPVVPTVGQPQPTTSTVQHLRAPTVSAAAAATLPGQAVSSLPSSCAHGATASSICGLAAPTFGQHQCPLQRHTLVSGQQVSPAHVGQPTGKPAQALQPHVSSPVVPPLPPGTSPAPLHSTARGLGAQSPDGAGCVVAASPWPARVVPPRPAAAPRSAASATAPPTSRARYNAAVAAASRQGTALIQSIIADKDPLEGARADIANCKAQSLLDHRATTLTDSVKDAVFESMTACSYNTEEMLQAIGLQDAGGAQDFSETLVSFFKEFLSELVATKVDKAYLQNVKSRFPTGVTADRWTSKACQRASRCFGLPVDGHCVHSVHQGRVRYYCPGPNVDMEVELFPGCESKWDLSAHRCGIWLVGTSSLGKDNALAIYRWCTEKVKSELEAEGAHGLVCFNELKVGRLTYCGLLAQLDEGKSPDGNTHWLTWANSEIRQCFGKGANDIQERDFCQLAEAVAIGKRIQDELVEKVPHFHFLIGAHESALHEVFGGVENGRLRGFSVPLEKANVMSISMAEKLAAQSISMHMLKDTTKAVVRLQHVSHNSVRRVKHSPATLTVVNALHEAVRAVVGDIDESGHGEQASIANALWPAMVKLTGKALCSLTVANLFVRNGVWTCDGDDAWVDDTTRLGDALAAALKVLLNMAGQGWCEAFIVAGGRKGEGLLAAPEASPDMQSQKPRRLTPRELQDHEAVGLRILAGLAWRDDVLQLLVNGGVRDRFNDKQHKALRYVRDMVGAPGDAWRNGIAALGAADVLVKLGDGTWKFNHAGPVFEYLEGKGVDARVLAALR